MKKTIEQIYRESMINESTWLPSTLSQTEKKIVGTVSSQLDVSIEQSYAFCVALLEDVNAHKEAKIVNDLLVKFLD